MYEASVDLNQYPVMSTPSIPSSTALRMTSDIVQHSGDDRHDTAVQPSHLTGLAALIVREQLDHIAESEPHNKARFAALAIHSTRMFCFYASTSGPLIVHVPGWPASSTFCRLHEERRDQPTCCRELESPTWS